MPKWKTFLTMEFKAEVEAENEDEARDRLFLYIFNGYNDARQSDINNIEITKWWGFGDEVKDERRNQKKK